LLKYIKYMLKYKEKVGWVTWRECRRIASPKRSSLKNWKGRDEEEDPGKNGEKK
jgi:hypothetical protein